MGRLDLGNYFRIWSMTSLGASENEAMIEST